MGKRRLGTEFLAWSLLILCSSLGQIECQQRPPPPPFAQPPPQQPFPQNALLQPQLAPAQPRFQNNLQAAGQAPTQAQAAGTPVPVAISPSSTPGVPVQFSGAQPQLDAFMPQLDPFIPKPVLFQLSTNIFNSAGLKVSHFSRFQVWYLTAQILKSVDERLKPDYITMLQPGLVKGIPSQNLTQALSQPHHPEILKTLVEQSSGMLSSQQAIVVQKIRSRLSEPAVIRMVMASESPAELFALFAPPLLARNMAAIIKTIGELPETLLSGTNIQARLLPRTMLSTWLTTVRRAGKLERWSADDLVGKSFLGSSNHLDLALLGLGCTDLRLVAEPDVLIVLSHFRRDLYELRKRAGLQLPFPLNLRNCAMERVLEYLRHKNGTAPEANILGGLRNAEIDLIGGEILSSIPASALDNVPAETRQAILEEIGQVDSTDLFNLLPSPSWFGNKLYGDLRNSSQGPMMPSPMPMALPNSLQIPIRMGSLLFYSNDFLGGNWSKEVVVDILASRKGSYCLPKRLRTGWATLLSATFGPIPAWTPNDLASIGDLLVVLPPTDLSALPLDTLARAVSTILRQSDLHSTVGSGDGGSFIRKCVNSLEDGPDFYMAYKLFMRKLLQATQLMVNSVRTIDEIVQNELAMGPGRVARSVDVSSTSTQAQENLDGRVRRQASAAIAAFRASQLANSDSAPSTSTAAAEAADASAAAQAQTPPPMVTGFIPQQPLRIPQQQFVPPRQALGPPPLRLAFAPRPPPQQIFLQQQSTPQLQAQAQAQATAQPTAQAAPTTTSTAPFVSRAATTQFPDKNQLSAPPSATLSQGQSQVQAPVPPATSNQGQSQAQAPVPPVQTPSASAPASSPAPAPAPQSGMQDQQPPPSTQTSVALSSRAATATPNAAQTGVQQQASAFVPSPATNTATMPMVTPSAAAPQQTQATQIPAQTFDTRALAPNQQQPLPQQALMGFQQPQQQQMFQRPFPGPPGLFPQQPPRMQFPGQQQQQPPLMPSGAGIPRPLNQSEIGSGTGADDNSTVKAGANTDTRSLPAVPGVIDKMITNATTTAVNATAPASAIDNLQGRSLDVGATTSNSTKEEDRRSTAFDMPKDSVEIPITCRGMKAAGPAAIGMTLADFAALSSEDLFDCVEPIGLIDWDLETKKGLLALLEEKLHLTPEGINTLSLIELGGLVSAFGVADNADGGSWLAPGTNSTTLFDISAIDLTLPDSLDGLSILGTQIEDPEVLKVLADKFTLQNQITEKIQGPISRPDNLRVVICSLGNVLCGLDEQIVAGIFERNPSLFIDVSPTLGQVVGCSSRMLQTLAEAAILPSNYGDPAAWTEQDVEVIGVVVAGLSPSQLASMQPASFAGLTPAAVRQLSTAGFQALSPDQVGAMPFESALAVQSDHLQVLSQEQMTALQGVVSVQSEDFNVPEVQVRGAGDRDEDDGLGDGSDLEMTRSLNETMPMGRATPDDRNSSTTGEGKKTNGTDGFDADDELVIEIVDDDDGANSNGSDTTPKTNRTRRPMKDKETSPSRPSAATTAVVFSSSLSVSLSLLFVHLLWL